MIVYSPPGTAILTADVVTEGWVPLSYLWEAVEGSPTIAAPTTISTDVTFPSPGRYILKFTASAPEHGTFLETLDDDEFVTEYNELFAVQGAGGEGFSPAVSTTVYTTVYVLPAVVGSPPEPDVIGADLHILINGVEYGIGALDPDKGALVDSISEVEGSEPNNASLTVRGFYPNDGDVVIINLDSERIFGGYVLRTSGEYDETWVNRSDQVNVVDFGWRLRTRRITHAYANTPVTTIVADIVAACPGFTVEYAQSDLGNLSVCLDGSLASSLDQICSLLSDRDVQWKSDYFKRVYIGTVFPAIPAPDPLTFAHPTVDQVKIDRELGSFISKIRVYGGEASVASNTPVGHKTILIDDATSFGNFTDGGNIYISGIANPETDDINKVDCFTTTFENLVTRDKPIFPDDIDVTDDPSTTASADCIAASTPAEDDLLDELIRMTNVQIEWRTIRVPNVVGLEAPVFYHYHATYVTAKGETAWKHWFQTSTVILWNGTFPVIPAGGTVYEDQIDQMKTNAIEFKASNIPPFIQRINFYRTVPSRGKSFLVGSISGKGQFGLLGSNAGPVDGYPIMTLNSGAIPSGIVDRDPPLYNLEFPGASTPVAGQPVLSSYNIGVVIGRSSGTLVDSKSDAELLQEGNLLGMPTTDKAIPKCASDADSPTDDPEKEVYLAGVNSPTGAPYVIPSGARVKRYIDLVDSAAQTLLASRLGDDGMVEGDPVTGTFMSMDEMVYAGRRKILDQNQQGNVGLEWQSRDRKTHPGTIVAVDFAAHFQGEVRIKSVEITQFEMVSCENGMKSYPLYSVSAEPRRVTLTRALRGGFGAAQQAKIVPHNPWRLGPHDSIPPSQM
jgi:hypothetical protein